MPFVRLNKANAWSSWQQGLIAAVNVDYRAARQSFLTNLAVDKGYNAIRVFMNYAGDGYWLAPVDYVRIGQSFAKARGDGTYGVRGAADVWLDPAWCNVTWAPEGVDSPDAWRDPELNTALRGWDRNDINSVHVYGRNYDWDTGLPVPVGQRSLVAGHKRIHQTADELRALMDQCASLGVGVILTFNFWAGMGDRMWAPWAAEVGAERSWNPTTPGFVQDSLAMFWMATAAKFGGHAALIGYDILNEPGTDDGAAWLGLARKVVAAIRQVDSQTPVVLEGHQNGASVGLTAFPTSDPLVTGAVPNRIVFSFHAYLPFSFSHQGYASWAPYESLGQSYPSASYVAPGSATAQPLGTAEDLTRLYQEAVDFKAASKAPVFVGEFSAIDVLGSQKKTSVPTTGHNRGVTSITVSEQNQTVTLAVGNMKVGGYAGEYGFQLAMSDTPAAELTALAAQNYPEFNRRFAHTVLVTLNKLAPKEREQARTTVSGSPGAYGDLLVSEADYAATDGIDSKIDALKIEDQPATLYRQGHEYVLHLTRPATLSVAERPPVKVWSMVDGGLQALPTRLPVLASVSIKPTAADLAGHPSSRLAYVQHTLKMCQAQGFSWAWLSETPVADGLPDFWNASPDMRAVLRDAAGGRRIK